MNKLKNVFLSSNKEVEYIKEDEIDALGQKKKKVFSCFGKVFPCLDNCLYDSHSYQLHSMLVVTKEGIGHIFRYFLENGKRGDLTYVGLCKYSDISNFI